MARPQKEGMDYFPHDVDAANDEKIEALRSLYGNDGYAFYFIMLERIYRTKNFELNISDAETIQILSRKVGVTQELFEKMVLTSVKHGAFELDDYNSRSVLTSNGIKKRANIVISKRVKMKSVYDSKVSDAETPTETPPETPQSKGKIKERESTEKEVKHMSVFEAWQSEKIHIHKGVSKAIEQQLNKLTVNQAEEVITAIKNYSKAFKDTNYYYNNVWTLDAFIKQSNGYKQWLDEGKMWVDYTSRTGNKTTPQTPVSKPQMIGVLPAKPLTVEIIPEW